MFYSQNSQVVNNIAIKSTELTKKILCVDFDNTLCYKAWPNIESAKQGIIHKIILWYVKYKQKQGWYIILNTCRHGKRLLDAIDFLTDRYFSPDYVNQNSNWLIEKYGDTRKISCDLNIDDTNIGFIGFLLRLYKCK